MFRETCTQETFGVKKIDHKAWSPTAAYSTILNATPSVVLSFRIQ